MARRAVSESRLRSNRLPSRPSQHRQRGLEPRVAAMARQARRHQQSRAYDQDSRCQPASTSSRDSGSSHSSAKLHRRSASRCKVGRVGGRQSLTIWERSHGLRVATSPKDRQRRLLPAASAVGRWRVEAQCFAANVVAHCLGPESIRCSLFPAAVAENCRCRARHPGNSLRRGKRGRFAGRPPHAFPDEPKIFENIN